MSLVTYTVSAGRPSRTLTRVPSNVLQTRAAVLTRGTQALLDVCKHATNTTATTDLKRMY